MDICDESKIKQLLGKPSNIKEKSSHH